MSYRTKMNIVILIFQLGFFILYSFVFFNDVNMFLSTGKEYRTNIVIIFAISQVVNLPIELLKNKNDKYDERNKKVEGTSSGVTIISMMFLSFIFLMILYVLNVDKEQIPIYWLWYLAFAYTSLTIIIFAVSNILTPLFGTKYED